MSIQGTNRRFKRLRRNLGGGNRPEMMRSSVSNLSSLKLKLSLTIRKILKKSSRYQNRNAKNIPNRQNRRIYGKKVPI
jgi:ribosomal protein L44E